MATVLVLGATGILGGRISALFRRLAPDVHVVGASRRARAGRRVDVRDAGSVRAALSGVDVLVNAVGPFEYDPRPILDPCLERGCHYVDIAEPEPYLRAAESAAAARTAGATVMPGCSTVPGLVELLARRWDDRPDVAGVRAFLSLGSKKRVSRTLLYSLIRPLGLRAPDGARYYGAAVRRDFAGTSPRWFGRYPASFERDGIAVGALRLPATFYVGMDRAAYAATLRLAAPVLSRLSNRRVWQLSSMIRPLTPLITRLGTSLGILAVEAIDGGGRAVDTIEIRAAHRGLDVPALPAVWATLALLQGRGKGGVVRLWDLFTPGEVAASLRREGFEVEGGGL